MSLTVLDTSKLVINGQAASSAYADLHAAIESAEMKETINGASTLTLSVKDAKGILRQSPVLKEYASAVLDGAGFTLCQVSRNAHDASLKLVFEDAAVRALRKHTTYRKVAAKSRSRAAFVQLLVKEEPWITVNAAPGALSLVELARGSANTTSTAESAGGAMGGLGNYGLDPTAGKAITLSTASKTSATTYTPESTWDAAQRIMGEIGWRVYAVRKVVTIAPDSWILAHGTPYAITDSSPGVIDIEWDWDVGKPAASATLTVTCGTTTSMPVGSRVTLSGQGPADGDWLVETIERTDRSAIATVELIRPMPVLAEPDATSALGNLGVGGFGDYGVNGLPGSVGKPSTGTGTTAPSALVEAFVQLALAQNGKPYVWGATGPGSFDCSGLVMWCAAHVGGTGSPTSTARVPYFGRNVAGQLALARRAGTIMSVEQAIATRGALLIHAPNEHIAISLGNGKTIEAHGKAFGVEVVSAYGRGFNIGAWVPGIVPSVASDRSGRAS